jgi:hypothetical protein
MPKRLTFDSIEPDKPRRVEFSARPADAGTTPSRRSRRRSRVIVKVAEPGYIPDGFEVAVRIDDTLFTALAGTDALDAASADDKVVSLARPRRVTN